MTPLVVEDVVVTAGTATLVDGVSLTVGPGEVVGLLGPNGSGKSSLLRTVYRVGRPASGRVLVDGIDVRRAPAREVARRVGVVLQDVPTDFPLTIREIVATGRSPHKRALQADDDLDHALVDAALELLDLTRLAGRRLDTLSGGERQRALVARALVGRPALLVMDEPTNHLDIAHQLALLELVGELGLPTLVALHDLNLAARYCHRLVLLDDGRAVVSGTPAEVLTVERIRGVYGVTATVLEHPSAACPLVVL
ncbi:MULTISPECIES: ABC transporter ATP-binding protein [Pseudonocardia]|uniref:Iron(3+)-hydroxamate import ATP-binding protein FhuC n=2 Tax=Pseudonocardia TaxID=1847 RepID=A0A1Y2NAG4_PSEAH|nr:MULTISPECIES: ABC transporter ATP-binding protein [Pseudonocardia]OSY44067.1 Iron(3+)-hydroxamate import ATP-binding protein FhuC [Pseudonocardia autotrophica]TDN74203.1 iron complex transport system ATP-binding protein [Pseudonocardia autotrophica]BBG04963.1 ABC transporter ATP-binding protein [Pseudonocardia autotrophica]GEC23619.1 ABC transporter ATP-binding protein [Pseudonocardia saturnea]